MFALAIYPIVQRIESECNLFVHQWYADDEMLVGKVELVKLALDIITEQGEAINSILNSSKTKAYWPTQDLLLLNLAHQVPRSKSSTDIGRRQDSGLLARIADVRLHLYLK